MYEFIGAGDNIAWIVCDAQHANQGRDLPDLIAIMDKTFGRGQTLTRRFFSTLAGANNAALDGSGVIYPEKTYPSIADMARNPYDIENYYMQWSRPGKYTLWSEDTFVTAGLSRVLTFHTDAHQVYLTLPDGSRLMSAAPSWNSRDLQNTPLSGNFHGHWPMFPNSVDDTGARPISIPNQTAFDATIIVSDASATGVTLRFSQPLNPNEFGVGLDAVSSWTTQWAAGNASVRIAYGSPLASGEDVNIIVFRAVDAAGNMIGGHPRLVVKGTSR